MSMERERWNEKITDLLRFIDLMVKQTCRRAYFDYQTRGRSIKEDKTSIYSIDHLRTVYEKPREHIYQLVKNPQKTLKGLRVDNQGFLERKDTRFTKIEQKMLLDFVKKIQDQSPPKQFIWIDLQHYLYYVYRNFACANPNPNPETLSAFYLAEMKELLNYLRKEDESQLWLRIFTILREYCIFAQWHYSQNDEEHALMRFFFYYEAMLTAAKNLVPVFTDFEKDIIYKNYKVCWIDFNTFIFIRFFYESDRVKYKISECLRTKNSPGDSPQMFTLMNDLKKLWSKEKTRISLIRQEGRLSENTPEAVKEKKILACHKKILSANFWIERSKEAKKHVDMARLDHNIFELLKDPQFFPEGPGLNKNGQCICEECLITKYKCFLDTNDDFGIIQTTAKTNFCRRCKCVLRLDLFHQHINNHSEDPKYRKSNFAKPTNLACLISQNMELVRLRNSTTNLSGLLNDKLKINDGNGSSKFNFDQYLDAKKEREQQPKVKNGRNRLFPEQYSYNGMTKIQRPEKSDTASSIVTPEKLIETELILRDIRRNGHKPCIGSKMDKTTEANTNNCFIPYEDLEKLDSKKCDCTYCEFFGSAQRGIQLKDRLRVRLTQRKEKRKENDLPGISNGDPNKIKASKVESRVPLPSSPSNIPSTPSDSSEYSVTSKEILEIVNYIEGNTIQNKAELSKKKAAKKARQKERREQERLQAELEAKRKLELKAFKEEERKKELERKEEERKLEEAQMKKKLKKKRQALKRQELERQKNTIEETIPAMVTIKRTPGLDNDLPSVTITLKGYTPDQDRLLTTLIDKSEAEILNEPQASNKNLVQTKSGKKKKSAAKLNELQSDAVKEVREEPKIIAKNVKVTLAVDKNPIPIIPDPLNLLIDQQFKRGHHSEDMKREREPTEDEIRALGNLKLPPGITITKVEGPVSNKNYLASDSNKNSSVLGKSGVIVVDTEKLIQRKDTDIIKSSKIGKRKKKKGKKNTETQSQSESIEKPKMVTLRNPMFQHYQNHNNKGFPVVDESAPAAIFTRENGMVTIRSSRLQQSLNNGANNHPNAVPFGISLMPNLLPEMPTFSNPNDCSIESSSLTIKNNENLSEKSSVTGLNAQEILSGLPGIEITKVDKKSDSSQIVDISSTGPDAQVSIIPSNGTNFDMEFDKDDDWLYDNVFKPRDVLEDDMDDEELELEAFKRFCQQSIPPKEKKVAHFNVADIVLKKKFS
ncbi:uncharacterized protein LOC143197350 isoform X1 [Rhynchophorus ferrugineus]|uniref:uncharacterized protein LOC143197350 isoform X1 n=1 Tax=Rhynchophorus ferrugineus TaxID=354439 RepID=UPI003FCE5E70